MSMRIKQKFIGSEIFLEEITYNTAGPLLDKYNQMNVIDLLRGYTNSSFNCFSNCFGFGE